MPPVTTVLEALQLAPGDRTAIIIPESGLRVTYAALRQQVLEMADTLAAAGVRRGSRVAIALPNGLPAIVSFLAATIAGTAAPMNQTYKYQEFCFYLQDTAAKVLIMAENDTGEAGSAAADSGVPILPVEMDGEGTVRLKGVDPKPWTTAPEPDEGAAAHIFQLSVLAFAPALMLFLVTADWTRPSRSVRPIAIPAAALATAFVALYCLEHYWLY